MSSPFKIRNPTLTKKTSPARILHPNHAFRLPPSAFRLPPSAFRLLPPSSLSVFPLRLSLCPQCPLCYFFLASLRRLSLRRLRVLCASAFFSCLSLSRFAMLVSLLTLPAHVCYMYTCYQISIRIAPRLAREKPLASHFALSPHPPQIRPIRATLLISIASTLFCTLFLETLCLQCVPQNNRGYTPFRKMSTPLQTDHLAPPRCHSPTPLR
jgi:hypothetical protein